MRPRQAVSIAACLDAMYPMVVAVVTTEVISDVPVPVQASLKQSAKIAQPSFYTKLQVVHMQLMLLRRD